MNKRRTLSLKKIALELWNAMPDKEKLKYDKLLNHLPKNIYTNPFKSFFRTIKKKYLKGEVIKGIN